MPNAIYLSLGSNIEPAINLRVAVSQLARYGTIKAASTVWETAPLGEQDQPNYLNAVLLLHTELSATDFQQRVIPHIEARLGRVRTTDPFAPRTIDIDILLFNRDILNLKNRRIPSPEIVERAFVAIPLAEIAPDYMHPVERRTLAEIASDFEIEGRKMRPRNDVRLTEFSQN